MSSGQNSYPIRQMFGVETAMRDGVVLRSDVWLPAAEGRYPIILERTPYLKSADMLRVSERAAYFARAGYAYAMQDARGRGDSEGKFGFFFQEAEDGYDTIESLAVQPWSNGRVGMMGISYMGTSQWLAAREKPPHLVCIAPSAPAGQYLNELPYIGGAFMLLWAVNWINDTCGRISQGANSAQTDWARVFAHRPLNTLDEAFGRKMQLFRDFLEHDTLDDYWKRIQFTQEDFAKIDIPLLVTTGWFDGDQAGTFLYWRGMNARGGADQYLTVGPWTHIQSFLGGETKVGEIELTEDSVVDNKAMHLAFFEHYLKQATAKFDQPRVRLYVTGTNVWRHFDAYPVPVKETRLYLGSGGKANTAAGDGTLLAKVATGTKSDSYVYDPKNPVPFGLDPEIFGSDRSAIETRPDVLVYSTPPLEKTVEIIGPIGVDLYAASDACDTDFTAVLIDVYPNGKPILLGSRPIGAIRARYRGGPGAKPELLTPGKPERFHISFGEIAHAFLPGHRIRIEISSSAAPWFNPNQNTGNPIATDTEWKIANQTILHDEEYPSALVLPVLAD